MSAYKGLRVKLTVRLPDSLRGQIIACIQHPHTNMSDWIIDAIECKLKTQPVATVEVKDYHPEWPSYCRDDFLLDEMVHFVLYPKYMDLKVFNKAGNKRWMYPSLEIQDRCYVLHHSIESLEPKLWEE